MSPGSAGAAAVGVGAALAGSLLSVLLSRKARREQNTQRLFGALVAGMLARLALYGAVIVYVALRTTLDPVAVAVWLLGSYVVLQVIEVTVTMRAARRGAR